MSGTYQSIVVMGRLGSDPSMKYLPDGITAVTSFSVAVDGFKDKPTVWFKTTAWRKTAELVNQHLSKGDQVLIDGTITASAYTAQDGTPRASLELSIDKIVFIDVAKWKNGAEGGEAASYGPPAADPTEDIPF